MSKPKNSFNMLATGLVVRELRTRFNMRLHDLAPLMSITPSSLSRIENGERKLFLDEAFLLSQVTGVPLQAMVEKIRELETKPELAEFLTARDKLAVAKANLT